MNGASRQALLLADALDQLVLNPTASHRWHALFDARNADPQPQLDGPLADAVLQRLPGDGVAGFLRATFLAVLTGDSAYNADAARLLLALTPFDVERVMAFVTLQWALGLYGGASHARFESALREARLPELLAMAGQALAGAPERLSARRIDAVVRIAVLAPMLGSRAHPPTEMALQQAALLTQAGYQVQLFACQELVQPQMHHYLAGKGAIVAPLEEVAQLAARAPAGTSVTVSDTRWSLTMRWRAMLADIARFDPDLVMFVGFASPLVAPLYAARPVLGLNVHALAPMAPTDVWLSADAAPAGRVASPWGPAMGATYAHYHPFRIVAPAATPDVLTRAELAIDEDRIIVISVGHRLVQEIDARWAARMCAVLARHPRAVWLLAGGDGLLPPSLASADLAQVRLLAGTPRLPGFYASCDVYANPPRLGGGLSAGEAMAAGVAVLALAGGDAGSKLGELAQPDDDSYFAQLDALLASAPARVRLGERGRERFATTLDLARSHDSLRAACEVALARFHARLEPARG